MYRSTLPPPITLNKITSQLRKKRTTKASLSLFTTLIPFNTKAASGLNVVFETIIFAETGIKSHLMRIFVALHAWQIYIAKYWFTKGSVIKV